MTAKRMLGTFAAHRPTVGKSVLNSTVLVATLLAGTACDSSTGPQVVSGTYALSTVNGKAVPFDVGRAPRSPGFSESDNCQMSISDGALTLANDPKAFTLSYETTNSCFPDRVFATSTEVGKFERRGNAIEFRAFDGQKDVIFQGIISGGRIGVTGTSFAFSFSR